MKSGHDQESGNETWARGALVLAGTASVATNTLLLPILFEWIAHSGASTVVGAVYRVVFFSHRFSLFPVAIGIVVVIGFAKRSSREALPIATVMLAAQILLTSALMVPFRP